MLKQRIYHSCLAVLAASVLCAATVVPAEQGLAQEGRGQQGLGERLGEQFDQGLNRLRTEVREGWESLRSTVDRMGVQGRVYSRLRWDKQLADLKIEVDVVEGGIVTLRGQVSDAEAQKKAVGLASDTVGVTRVIDELRVLAPDETPNRPSGPAEVELPEEE
ncbi:BON domain-containing protein [Candidatus Laterigemmans baculatus]|uniref:BON domain-containing protein n=1 Tax=Candidatus Laterigemmans baculatus TaxID=2770505 RepID=UPI0013DB49BD|nr:BON domain-containing protein [Candidatus Laterigemmans baculatus]